ncbi:MAG: phage holin family protein [Candidatus Nanopelagicales bacterium]|nr:phage holin family protein [Candidatus Nanopelagicales bacterium]
MPDSQQPSLKELIAKTVIDGKRLASAQLALAKAEMTASRNAITTAAAFGMAALIMTPLALLFLLFTLAYGLVQMGLQTWAAFGIVALLLIALIVVAALVAKAQASKVKGPDLALRELTKTQEAFGVETLDPEAFGQADTAS